MYVEVKRDLDTLLGAVSAWQPQFSIPGTREPYICNTCEHCVLQHGMLSVYVKLWLATHVEANN